MSDKAEKTSKEKDNLARIRENQRRSRARRKEYLSELEMKWRECQQSGVEVTAEVQAAARQVLDENKRLRSLLRLHGVSDYEIDAFELNGVSNGGTYATVPASMSLQTMMMGKMPCGSSCSSSKAPEATSTIGNQAVHSGPLTNSVFRGPSPHRAVSQDPSVHENSTRQRQTSWQSDFQTLHDASESNVTQSTRHSDNPQPATAEFPTDFESWGQDLPVPTVPTSSVSTCSCIEAANMIRDMGGDTSHNVVREMGCDADDPHCRANAALVFEMIDRYQQSSLG